ncbi:mutS protein 4 [Sarcoptes scabiei]|nr:mutS protein 4 [Sarcoptes scabiei]
MVKIGFKNDKSKDHHHHRHLEREDGNNEKIKIERKLKNKIQTKRRFLSQLKSSNVNSCSLKNFIRIRFINYCIYSMIIFMLICIVMAIILVFWSPSSEMIFLQLRQNHQQQAIILILVFISINYLIGFIGLWRSNIIALTIFSLINFSMAIVCWLNFINNKSNSFSYNNNNNIEAIKLEKNYIQSNSIVSDQNKTDNDDDDDDVKDESNRDSFHSRLSFVKNFGKFDLEQFEQQQQNREHHQKQEPKYLLSNLILLILFGSTSLLTILLIVQKIRQKWRNLSKKSIYNTITNFYQPVIQIDPYDDADDDDDDDDEDRDGDGVDVENLDLVDQNDYTNYYYYFNRNEQKHQTICTFIDSKDTANDVEKEDEEYEKNRCNRTKFDGYRLIV